MANAEKKLIDFSHRPACAADLPALKEIMAASIRLLQQDFLSADQIDASHEVMGLDTQLVEDGTYYMVFEGETLVGCGGWSSRTTLFGADHSRGRDATMLDPNKDAARIRAMYTHPDHGRKGVGRYIMQLCEGKAAAEGFKSFELMATLAGVPLYKACSYEPVEHRDVKGSSGVKIPMVRMRKDTRHVA